MATTDPTGGDQPVDNMQPYGTLNYAIAIQGIFPPRSLQADSQALSTGDSNPFIGEIIQFAGDFAPRGYALCNGQILSIAQNTALFAILGTTYGGDGRTTFALPDLRGRTPIGTGQGPGLTPVELGQASGSATVTLTEAQLPAHQHLLNGTQTGTTGNGQPISTLQPTLGLSPIITLEGAFGDLGHIGWFAGNFAPAGHAFAHGQLLPISEYNALFAVIGATYGGDGQTTFALPDLRGRIAVDDGLTQPLGASFGTETVTLTTANLPAHSHTVTIPGLPNSTSSTGTGQSFSTLQPSLALSYEIALSGIFPPRNLQTEIDTGSDDTKVDGLVVGENILNTEAATAAIHELAQAGIARWQLAGISPEQVAQLETLTYQIADLEPGYLAVFGADNVVTIDIDASNRRWFVDATPSTDEEFGSTDPSTGERLATDTSALASFDLLTTIMHEQGHKLGLNHAANRGSIMFGSLGTGGRFLPAATDLVASSNHETASPFLTASDSFIAQVGMYAGANNGSIRQNFAFTSGQLLPINQNQALFSLLGIIYGGNGITNFALPDFRDRTVLHVGAGTGLPPIVLGEAGGSATTTLTLNQMPTHTHTVVNNPPIAVNDSGLNATQGIAKIIPVGQLLANDSDSEGTTLRMTSVSNATNGSAVLNNNGTPNDFSDDFVGFTPDINFSGDATFQYTVSDGVSSANATVTLTVGIVLIGSDGDDILNGTPGDDILRGGIGRDTLTGFVGDDILGGGRGKDSLFGGGGADTLTGGLREDTFLYTRLLNSRLSRADVITDLQIGADIIDAPAAVSAANVTELGSVTALTPEAIANLLTPTTFAANLAATFSLGGRTFLALNDSISGFQDSNDAVIEITGFTGNLTDLAII